MRVFALLLILRALLLSQLWAQAGDSLSAKEEARLALFGESEPIQMVISSNVKVLLKDRGDVRMYHGATLSYLAADGDTVAMPIQLRVRGNFRRTKSVCEFPPLRIKFDKKKNDNTIFDGQGKLKLVTHCNTKKEAFEQNTLLEYLIYKSYNLLTDYSFKVRLVRVQYRDTDGNFDPVDKFGFLIEDDDDLAERQGGRILKVTNVHPYQTDGTISTLMAVFQFMIGNTDWSIPNLHNVKLIMGDPALPPIAVAYDFDLCGMINAPYAKPNPMMGISSVRERVFRGFCRPESEFRAVIALFLRNKEAILDLYRNNPYLNESTRKKAVDYYEEFFEIIENEKKLDRRILSQCRTDE